MASARLTRTVGAGNRRTWTWSGWVKRTKLSYGDAYLMGVYVHGADHFRFYFPSSDQLHVKFYNNTSYELLTNRRFRDTNAWYHIVLRVDNTQSTASNRFRLYVNGEQETSFATENQPTQNLAMSVNDSNLMEIGSYNNGGFFEGCMAHVNFVDGQALAPTEFGETDTTTGIWKPKTAPSVTYGTNGFFLKFDNSGNMGLDSAGSNNYTTSGTVIQNKDTPSNVFATFNPLVKLTDATLTNANTTCAYGSASTRRPVVSTLAVTSGKYYYEAKVTASSSGTPFATVGIGNTMNVESYGNYLGATNGYSTHYQVWDGGVIVGNSNQETVTASVVNDIIGVAFDVDNYKIYFYKNGTLISSSSGIDFSGQTSGQGFWTPAIGDAAGSGTFTISYNFGNGYFGTTAVSSAQNPTDGVGIFEYTPPTNYRAVCTKSINAQEYS